MSAANASRERILSRVHMATAVSTAASQDEESLSSAPLPHAYLSRGALDRERCLELMIERLREYDAEVMETTPERLQFAITTQLASSGKRILAAPEGLPAEWLVPGFEWKIDRNLAAEEIELVHGVVTAAFCGVADSGTIVLHHGAAEGRRVLTLLPDWHLCILRENQIVETLPEYFSRCSEPPKLATYISGPSATADIEMTRIKGVHGPRDLHVILIRDENP